MIRKFKGLGLAIVAAFAMSAVSASAASAADFHSEASHTILSGTQTTTNVFTSATGNVSCKKATFAGTTSATTVASVTVTPTYGECTAFGLSATVNMNGCAYILYANGTADVECSGTNKIVIDAAGCDVTIGAQTGLSGVSYTNTGSGTTRVIVVDLHITGIAYEEHGFLCETETEKRTDGTLSGSVTVTGTNTSNEHVGIWHQ